MLSLGGKTGHSTRSFGDRFINRLYRMKWPPLGLQKDDEFFEYGLFWVLAASMEAGLAMIDR
jgi:hypothetical protein